MSDSQVRWFMGVMGALVAAIGIFGDFNAHPACTAAWSPMTSHIVVTVIGVTVIGVALVLAGQLTWFDGR